MLSGPHGEIQPAFVRGWIAAALTAAALAAGAAALSPGQQPADGNTAAQPPAAPANQAQTNPPSTSSSPVSPVQVGAMPAEFAQAVSTTTQTAPAQVTAAGGDARSQQVARQTADLLKMAIDLKAELDRTRPTTLSLAVVRKASAIEQLAKKMRSQP